MLWHCQGLSASFPLSGWTRRGSSLLVCEGWHPLSQSLKQAEGVAPMFILAPLFPPVLLEDTVAQGSHTLLLYGCRRLWWSRITYTCLHASFATPIFICREAIFWIADLETFFFGKRLSCRLFGIHWHGWQYLRWNFYIYSAFCIFKDEFQYFLLPLVVIEYYCNCC